MPSELHAERREHTLVLTLSDPASRNTLSEQIFSAGVEALDVAESDPGVRCIVLQGEGAHFCAGDNPQQLQAQRQMPPDVQSAGLAHFRDFIEALRVFPKPVIAAVEGAATGSGFSLALACDLVVAAADARFSLSFGRLGLSPDGGATWQLMQRVPRPQVLQWLWLSEQLTAQQLQTCGLVNWVVASGQALNRALEVAARLAECAPNAIASAKELVNQWPQRSLPQQMDAEHSHFLANLLHSNAAEGLAALMNKRDPGFD